MGSYKLGARNQDMTGGAYKFHIHRAYIIYDNTDRYAALIDQLALIISNQ